MEAGSKGSGKGGIKGKGSNSKGDEWRKGRERTGRTGGNSAQVKVGRINTVWRRAVPLRKPRLNAHRDLY